jgi:GNAT superfamily N-acetyltransferase
MKIEAEIYNADLHDVPKIAQISDLLFGRGFITSTDVEKFIDDVDKNIWVARVQDEIVGFATSVIISDEGNETLQHYLNGSGNILYNTAPFLSESVAVEPSHSGAGLGLELFRQVAQWGLNKKCKYLLGLGWLRNGVSVAEKMFNKIGGQRLTVIPDFWLEDSLKHGYVCVECGNPCKCSAILLLKTFG